MCRRHRPALCRRGSGRRPGTPGRPPGRAARPADSRRRSMRPKSRTVTSSAIRMTIPMSCSTIRTEIPRASLIREMVRAMARRSAVFIPATGSSRSSSLGSMHKARASSTRLRSPYGNSPTGESTWVPRPVNSAISRTLSWCSRCSRTLPGSRSADAARPARVKVSPAQHQVVRDRALGEDDVLEGPGHTECGDPVRGQGGQLGVAEEHPAGGGAVDAGQDVEAGRLPCAVGADECMDAPGFHGEPDAVQGRQPGETYGDVLDDQGRHLGVRGRNAHGRCPAQTISDHRGHLLSEVTGSPVVRTLSPPSSAGCSPR